MRKGQRHTKKSRKKMAEAKRGVKRAPHTEETRAKISAAVRRAKAESSWLKELRNEYGNNPEAMEWIVNHREDLLLSNPLNGDIDVHHPGRNHVIAINDVPSDSEFDSGGYHVVADDLTPEKVVEIFEECKNEIT